MTEPEAVRLLGYCRKLELLLALLVAQHGQPHDGGYRLRISNEQAYDILTRMGTMEPVVLHRFDDEGPDTQTGYVIDVL